MKKNNFTLVTGLWDIGRGDLGSFGRNFDHYLECFDKLLSLDYNICAWIPSELSRFVNSRRSSTNTKLYIKNLKDFNQWFSFFQEVDEVRTAQSWYKKAEWLQQSPQAKLEYYNPIVMSKFFMLNDTALSNPFNTDYFFWIDGGITNTVSIDYLQNLGKLPKYMQSIDNRLLFLSFPYESDYEVHGFDANKFNEFCGVNKTKYVCRGGFFGGTKENINYLNGKYYDYLRDSLSLKCMGTEENIHTILAYRYPDRVHRFELEDNGLVYKFFDSLKEIVLVENNNTTLIPYDKRKDVMDIKTSMYVLTFNSPDQFESLFTSYLKSDRNFITKTRKILIDNSTDHSTYLRYNDLCKSFGFEHIKKEDNIGICGGRQFVAEHFNESDSEYYIFLEDDMNLHDVTEEQCKSGHKKYIDNLYEKSLTIMHKECYDYLKLTFTEFYGDNRTQWAWYNVPQHIREHYFPDHPNLPESGLSDSPPIIVPKKRKRHKDLYYLEGDYYYCNWPLWFSRAGNRKVFLDIKWSRPFEQTWMSNVFQLQQKGQIKSAVLELSPINHERFAHYDASERVES